MELWNEIVNALQSVVVSVIEWAPRVLGALLVLIIGRILLGVIRKVIVKLLGLSPANAVFDRAGLTTAVQPSGKSPAELVATIVYAILFVALWMIVFDILGLFAIADLLQRLLRWIPVVFIAAAVVLIAAAVATWVSELLRPFASARNVSWLPGIVRAGIIVFGALAALDILNINFADNLVRIVVAGAVLALAIAFGVGGIDTAKKWWERYLNPPAERNATSGAPSGGPTGGAPPGGSMIN